MILTIFRHGEAGDAPTDRQRQLTDRGRDDIAFACRQFHDACHDRGLPQAHRILYSPWTRTLQTADIISGAFTHALTGAESALRPDSDIPAVDGMLAEFCGQSAKQEHLLLVSHQPLVSRLVDHYLGERGAVPGLSPGGLATLSLDVPATACAQLLFWALPPEYRTAY